MVASGHATTRSHLACAWTGASSSSCAHCHHAKYASGPKSTPALAASRGASARCDERHCSTAMSAREGAITIPMLLVSAASAPARAAIAHRSRRANQKANTDHSRHSDSLYGAKKKNAVGKIAMYTTVLQAMSFEYSRAVRSNRTRRARKKAPLDTSSDPSSG